MAEVKRQRDLNVHTEEAEPPDSDLLEAQHGHGQLAVALRKSACEEYGHRDSRKVARQPHHSLAEDAPIDEELEQLERYLDLATRAQTIAYVDAAKYSNSGIEEVLGHEGAQVYTDAGEGGSKGEFDEDFTSESKENKYQDGEDAIETVKGNEN
ncbi:hypothetical protein BDV95DRAFT_614825 [Massariosphaeria phaeospora]|uniref:Uncharacterized protein n=1 Tax=Massariosphaeria phaeospora TaxID=100035 RepID=A0A7C8IM77_9PLEO|nr:hypothetical protein BDV95DRAFT_614825 [Massariosphaeria phaeospora]